jgi:hypothetical protein
MKSNIINISIIFFISIVTTGCIKLQTPHPPVNSYAIEKSAPFKCDDITSKIINETSALYMSYPFSMEILLLSTDAITPFIPLSDKGVMSEEYYLNTYIEEQDLVYAMFERRKTFTKLKAKYVNRANSSFNHKGSDFVMFFGASTLGELDIYLKDTTTNRTFLIWQYSITEIDPIQAVENILKAKILYTTPVKNNNIKYNKSFNSIKKTTPKTKPTQNVDFVNVTKELVPITKPIQNVNRISTIKKQSSKTESIQNAYNRVNKSKQKTKNIKKYYYNYYKKDSTGCYAYNSLNECVVW